MSKFNIGDVVVCNDLENRVVNAVRTLDMREEDEGESIWYVDVAADGVSYFYEHELRLATELDKALYE